MISVYGATAQEWIGNGLAVLRPTRCVVHEKAAGVYELQMTHPITEDLRWKTLSVGNVIKAPVPAAETPAISIYHEEVAGEGGSPAREIWKVRITTQYAYGYSRIYKKPSTSSKVLKRLKEGTEYEYIGRHNGSWHKAVSADGVSGYMWTDNSVFVRNEPEQKPIPSVPGHSTVVQPRQIREQFFRIYDTAMDTKSSVVTVYARHISYDLMGNITTACKLENADPRSALEQIRGAFIMPDDRELYTTIDTAITEDYSFRNGVEIFMDPEIGLVQKMSAKLVRDNEDFFLLKNDPVDRGVTITHGKNLLGVSYTENTEDVVTRIMPIGEDKEGNPLLLPEVYVDSANIGNYPTINAQKLEVQEARVSDKMTIDQAYAKMREAARAQFEAGCDAANVSLDVNFVMLGDTEEFKQYKDLQQVFLYDTITVYHQPTQTYAKAQVAEYEWDAILERYNRVKVGNVLEVTGSTIAGFQLPSGGISGSKLVMGGVDGSRLRDLSVTNAKIGTAAITYAKIASATIELLQADSIKAAVAELDRVISGSISTNELYAKIIQAVSAEIGTVTSGSITTNELYAQIIKAAAMEIGKVTAGEIETNDLYAQIIAASVAELGKVSAGSIETNDLYAEIVKAIRADLGRVTAGEIETSELYAILGEVVNLTATTADIDFARIKDLITGDAIFTKGEAEELYITRLAVTEANMLTLTVGQLVVKGVDGRYYQLVVDPESEDGFSLREVEMDGDQLVDNTVAGGKIIENSITARELNVETIFADEAIIREILAGYGQFGDLEAINGFIGKLETQLIQSSGLKVLVKDDIDSLRTEVNQRTDGLEARVEANENGISTLQTGVTVDATGVTIRQPNQTDNTMVLRAGSMTINAPGREALVISQEESYMPNLRVTQLVMGNLVTTVSGSGADCRVVSQYVQ